MATYAPKILTVRFVSGENEPSSVLVEFGAKQIAHQIAAGQGVVRLAAILGDSGQLTDVELITEKL